ncbi:hypothetical protein IDM40_04845 [Nocardiopsis sp. HNM0947]|uniref:Uncharacterized protein n=1 Tax=Nocardiopsis coralli TaxID=2772213 RepID=A0ABR9P2H2_9ACTN|nr:hypothetical protein [Nocardiopsis coralli]MBE2998038.1 hypothetical protein [Nocardiopsis coralli]
MSTDPEPTTETEDLRTRLARVEAHAEAMEAHVLDIRFQERRRALSGLLLALGGLLISLFLPWTEETGVYLLSILSETDEEESFAAITAAATCAMLVAGCVALPFLSRPGASATLTGFAVLIALASGALLLQSFFVPFEDHVSAGVLVAFASAIAAPVSAARVAKFPKADSEPHPARKKSP